MRKIYPQFISTAEFANSLGISVVAVCKRIKKGQIKAIKIGRSYAIPRIYLEDPTGKLIHKSIETENYVSVMQAAEMLGITRMAVFNKIKSGRIHAEKVGRHYIISKSQLDLDQKPADIKAPIVQKEFVSIPELAQIMGVSRIAIFKKVQKGEIKAHKVGRHYVIARKDIVGDEREGIVVPAISSEQLSIVEVAKVLGISRIAVFKKIQKGQLQAQKIGRSYAINRNDFDEFKHIAPKGGDDV